MSDDFMLYGMRDLVCSASIHVRVNCFVFFYTCNYKLCDILLNLTHKFYIELGLFQLSTSQFLRISRACLSYPLLSFSKLKRNPPATVEDIGTLYSYLQQLGYNVDAIIDHDKYNDWVVRQMYRYNKTDVLANARPGWRHSEDQAYSFPYEHTVRFTIVLMLV